MTGLDVAIVGATGVVGQEFLLVLDQRAFPVRSLRAYASAGGTGRAVLFQGEPVPVEDAADATFEGADVVFFSAGAEVSRTVAPRAAAAGALVVDNSSAFRGDPEVPLVVPQVNAEAAHAHRGIIANPNCSTILLAVVLAPLERRFRVERVVCATYQAVSGSGARAIEEWEDQIRAEQAGADLPVEVYPKAIHGNVLPVVGAFGDGDLTVEEWKMVHETRRLLDRPDLPVTATCVRVPVRRAHSEAVNLQFGRPAEAADVRACLREAPGVRVVDDPGAGLFPTPRDAEGLDDVLVGRIRRDPSLPQGIDLWITGDQIRKGAALNAVEIAESVLGVGGPRLDRS